MPEGKLTALSERINSALEPDRTLDADIYRAVFGISDTASVGWASVPPYTASIDSAVALAEGVAHKHGRKLICFFCAGGQLTSDNADPDGIDYHPLARIDNSVTVGWMAHVAFFKPEGSESYGPERYTHGRTAGLAIVGALLTALALTEQKP